MAQRSAHVSTGRMTVTFFDWELGKATVGLAESNGSLSPGMT